jgi:mannitol/fructose-specific phosphotransferase system IIA component
MLGDGIALPHSLGLLAKKTVVYTVIAPQGIGHENIVDRHRLFILALADSEQKDDMGGFVTPGDALP